MLCNLLYENVMKAELYPEFPAMLRSTRKTATQSTRQLSVILKQKTGKLMTNTKSVKSRSAQDAEQKTASHW